MATIALADSGVYRICDVNGGIKASCTNNYNGMAVIERGDFYELCEISIGRVFSCKGWFTGKAIGYTTGSLDRRNQLMQLCFPLEIKEIED